MTMPTPNEIVTKVWTTVGDLVGKGAELLTHGTHDGPAIEIDDDGWMHGDHVNCFPLEDKMQPLVTPDGDVDGIVWHYTDTKNAGADNLAKRIQRKGGRSASCHVWIDADAMIAQSAPFKKGTWHAGSNTAKRFYRAENGVWTIAGSGRVRGYGANSWAAGIELESVGEVREIKGRWLGWPFRTDYHDKDGTLVRPAIVDAKDVVECKGRHYHRFTDAQINAAELVAGALVRRYGLIRENCEWGHSQIDPTRRTDPGPMWLEQHLPRILDRIYA